MKTKTEIINETVEFYSKNSRSVTVGECSVICLYIGNNGENCAFSRCCTEEGKQRLHKNYEGITLGQRSLSNYETFLKQEYCGHSQDFWVEIQKLHDVSSHWKDGKLSESGGRHVSYLLKRYEKD
jgi:hypothetical protein